MGEKKIRESRILYLRIKKSNRSNVFILFVNRQFSVGKLRKIEYLVKASHRLHSLVLFLFNHYDKKKRQLKDSQLLLLKLANQSISSNAIGMHSCALR